MVAQADTRCVLVLLATTHVRHPLLEPIHFVFSLDEIQRLFGRFFRPDSPCVLA
jgi:hypothetical protein